MANLRKGTACRLNSIWEQNTKIEIIETGWKALDWIHLGQTRNISGLSQSNEPITFIS
jgi:hypothetical protein